MTALPLLTLDLDAAEAGVVFVRRDRWRELRRALLASGEVRVERLG